MAADGHGFLVSVLVATLLLLNCTATWDFGSNVPVTIGVTNLAVNKTEICFLFKSTAEFMVSIYMPNARDVQHELLFSRASLMVFILASPRVFAMANFFFKKSQETLEFAVSTCFFNSLESLSEPLHRDRDGICIHVIGVPHHQTPFIIIIIAQVQFQE